MMAVDLHTEDSSLSSHFLTDTNTNASSSLYPHRFGSMEEQSDNDRDDDFAAELTRQMAHFMFQDDDNFDFTDIAEMSWDSIDSPQSTLWSNQGSSESISLEPTPPATPGDGGDSWRGAANDVVGMLENMIVDERGHSKYLHGYGNQSCKDSDIGLCFNQALIDQQIRAVQLSRLQQEQAMKQKPTAYRESQSQISPQTEPKEQTQKKGKGCGFGSRSGRRNRPTPLFSSNTRPAPLQQIPSQIHHQTGPGMQALFLSGSGPRTGSCGTGVFLPRGTTVPSEPRKKSGCSTVLIPARVVQALQLHFDQIAATSGPKAGGFPPLQDVLVSNKDGMYSLQKRRQSRKDPENIQQSETMLPQEWTY